MSGLVERGRWRREPTYTAAIALGRLLFWLLGLRREVRSAQRLDITGPAVLALTHFSYLDFALAEWAVWRQSGRLVRYLATARAFEHPAAGPLLRGMRHVPVERAAGGAAYRHAVSALRAGELVGVFPEARVNHGIVGPLKSGAVRMAMETGAPLVPVVVWGGQHVLSRGQGFRLRRAFGARIVIAVGEPMVLPPGVDVEAATAGLHQALERLRPDCAATPAVAEVPGLPLSR